MLAPLLASIILQFKVIHERSHIDSDSGNTKIDMLSYSTMMKNDLSVEDATELALDRPLWRLLAASRATH